MNKSNTVITDKHEYLQMGKTIDPAINILHCEGRLPSRRVVSAAIVGARKPTAYGTEVGYRLAYELAQAGVVIISGLALGIDGVAHQAAIDASGVTLAILGSGLDVIYPARHTALAADIVRAGGALISEYEPGTPPMKYHFLERNRLVSGLADVVIVVEAASRSGTLSTASWGLQQGKTVMAVPGNITSPLSSGCNQLIKSGATPVTSTSDVLFELGLGRQSSQAQMPLLDCLPPKEAAIIKLLQSGIRHGEALQQKSSLSAAEYLQTITLLEISGKVRALGANQWGLATEWNVPP